MHRLLIKNGTLITMNPDRDIFTGDILISGPEIIKVTRGPMDDSKNDASADQVIDATGKYVIPGLIQAHVHLTQALFRGQGDDMALLDWLKYRIWPLEGSHTKSSNYLSACLGIAELIKGGTTSVIDMESVHHTESAFKAILETGFRAVSGKCMMDDGDIPMTLKESTDDALKESERLLLKWHGEGNGRIQYALSPRFAISSSKQAFERVRDMANYYGVMVHSHASENKMEIQKVEEASGYRNIKLFDKMGLTGPNLVLAHCIWLNDEEIEILADTATHVAHCPSANMKLASGFARVPEMLASGINVSLGSDGAPCNNNMDMFVEMRHGALMHKANLLDPTVMSARQVFEMATLGGARAMGLEHKLGSIEAGKYADLVVVDLNKTHLVPDVGTDPISRLVYAAQSADVLTTIIHGKVVMQDRELIAIDEGQLLKDTRRVVNDILKRAGLK